MDHAPPEVNCLKQPEEYKLKSSWQLSLNFRENIALLLSVHEHEFHISKGLLRIRMDDTFAREL